MKRRESFPVGTRPSVEVRLGSGRLDVETGAEGEVVVELDGRGADAVEVIHSGDLVVVRRHPDRAFGSGSVRARLVAPAGTDYTFALASCDVRARGTLGALEVRTASGDVVAESVAAVEVRTASGDVSVDRVEDRAKVSSASGEVRIGESGGDVSCSTASGDVRIGVAGGDLRVTTASGDVEVGRFDGDEIRIRSVSGDLDLGLPAGTRVEVDVTTLSGEVRLPENTTVVEESAPRRKKVRLVAHTVSGDVVVRRL